MIRAAMRPLGRTGNCSIQHVLQLSTPSTVCKRLSPRSLSLAAVNPPAVAHHPLPKQEKTELTPSGDPFQTPLPERFAVIQLHNTQYKVTTDDVIFADNLPEARVGHDYIMDKVLLVGSRDCTVVGRPTVPNATVTATCEEHTHTATKLVFRKQRRKHFQKTHGHRSKITILRVKSVDYELPSQEESAQGETEQR
eukprot:gb/GECG01015375.1/.p1 GENE.gb/GECG01015375.1/~~gb/GECG01015375.1/.p1  ORF type:complete len:195 (+),score=14.05 gb/GECG01015375.1/:1-585(+)